MVHLWLQFSHTGDENVSHLIVGLGGWAWASCPRTAGGNWEGMVPLSPMKEFLWSPPSKLPVPGKACLLLVWQIKLSLPYALCCFCRLVRNNPFQFSEKVFLYVLLLDPYCACECMGGAGLDSRGRSLVSSSEDKTTFFNALPTWYSGANTSYKKQWGFSFLWPFASVKSKIEWSHLLSLGLGFLPKEKKQGREVNDLYMCDIPNLVAGPELALGKEGLEKWKEWGNQIPAPPQA